MSNIIESGVSFLKSRVLLEPAEEYLERKAQIRQCTENALDSLKFSSARILALGLEDWRSLMNVSSRVETDILNSDRSSYLPRRRWFRITDGLKIEISPTRYTPGP